LFSRKAGANILLINQSTRGLGALLKEK